MAMADTALPPAHKLLPTVSLPLLSSSTHAAPLLLRASRRLPLAPLVASSDAVEAGVEWADEEEEEEEEAGEAFDEEAGEVEEEVLASGDEGEGEYAAVEPPEEAKVYVGNLPYDIDSEGLAQLFDQAGVVEVAEVSRTRLTLPKFPIGYDVRRSVGYNCLLCLVKPRFTVIASAHCEYGSPVTSCN
jgi:nucleolin